MLDAAETLLESGGPGALTVEEVVRASETSTGSFYARFGDRRGLLVAMQDRFLERLETSLSSSVASSNEEPDLSDAIERLTAEFLSTFRQHRAAFNAFMLINRSEPTMRLRGAQASRDAANAIGALLALHSDEVTHPDHELAADFVYRTLFALATQTVMFDDGEVSTQTHNDETWATECARLLLAYLMGT
jgi:AcrR family transcriptional regulator